MRTLNCYVEEQKSTKSMFLSDFVYPNRSGLLCTMLPLAARHNLTNTDWFCLIPKVNGLFSLAFTHYFTKHNPRLGLSENFNATKSHKLLTFLRCFLSFFFCDIVWKAPYLLNPFHDFFGAEMIQSALKWLGKKNERKT